MSFIIQTGFHSIFHSEYLLLGKPREPLLWCVHLLFHGSGNEVHVCASRLWPGTLCCYRRFFAAWFGLMWMDACSGWFAFFLPVRQLNSSLLPVFAAMKNTTWCVPWLTTPGIYSSRCSPRKWGPTSASSTTSNGTSCKSLSPPPPLQTTSQAP